MIPFNKLKLFLNENLASFSYHVKSMISKKCSEKIVEIDLTFFDKSLKYNPYIFRGNENLNIWRNLWYKNRHVRTYRYLHDPIWRNPGAQIFSLSYIPRFKMYMVNPMVKVGRKTAYSFRHFCRIENSILNCVELNWYQGDLKGDTNF